MHDAHMGTSALHQACTHNCVSNPHLLCGNSHLEFQDTNKSNIVVLLDHPDPELLFLTFSAENPSLDLAQSISLVEDGAPISEFYHGVLVDPNGELAVISTYQGKVKILQLADGLSVQESDAR